MHRDLLKKLLSAFIAAAMLALALAALSGCKKQQEDGEKTNNDRYCGCVLTFSAPTQFPIYAQVSGINYQFEGVTGENFFDDSVYNPDTRTLNQKQSVSRNLSNSVINVASYGSATLQATAAVSATYAAENPDSHLRAYAVYRNEEGSLYLDGRYDEFSYDDIRTGCSLEDSRQYTLTDSKGVEYVQTVSITLSIIIATPAARMLVEQLDVSGAVIQSDTVSTSASGFSTAMADGAASITVYEYDKDGKCIRTKTFNDVTETVKYSALYGDAAILKTLSISVKK